MPHKFDPGHVDRLESPERYESMPPERTLRNLGLRRGMTFVDVGAGTGFFSLPAAQVVGPKGRVYALDVEPAMLSSLAAKAPPSWLETMPCQESSLPLPPGTGDMVFTCFVLHETRDPLAFLRDMGRVAKPYAPVVILEWAKRRQKEGPAFGDRLHHHRVEELVLEAGLCFKSVDFFNASQYAVQAFKKR